MDPIELETSSRLTFKPSVDRRLKVPEPLPVKLVAVADVRLPAPAGVERQLDALYAGLLGFRRAPEAEGLAYYAENFTLRFDVVEPPVRRPDFRAVGVQVLSLREAEEKLIEAEVEYTRQRGLLPGEERLVLVDPAGNWVELVESREV